MNLREHAAKLSWTALDKLLFIGFGVVTLLQIRSLSPEEWGLASQLITLQTWIFIITDGSALQSIIQFGVDEKNRGKVNLVATVVHVVISLVLSLAVTMFQAPLALAFKEARFASVASTLPLFCLLTVPRALALKLLQRELHMRDIFFTNLAWFGTMSVLTFYKMWQGTLSSYEDMAYISLVGISVSSVVGIILSRRMLEFSLNGDISVATIVRFSMPQALMVSLNNAIRQLDVFFVQTHFGTTNAGVYSSAKMLYRVFETATDAGISLMYPTAVKLFSQDRQESVIATFSKAISYILLPTVAAIIVLQLGATTMIVSVLGSKYVQAASQFNMMSFAALFLPFFILQSVLLALHKVGMLLQHVAISVFVGFVTFELVGRQAWWGGMPLGVITYSATFALLLLYDTRKLLHFPLSHLFRAIPDTISMITHFRESRNSQK